MEIQIKIHILENSEYTKKKKLVKKQDFILKKKKTVLPSGLQSCDTNVAIIISGPVTCP